MSLIDRAQRYLAANGVRGTVRRAGEKTVQRVGRTWDRAWKRLAPNEETLAKQREEQPSAGLISVVVPVWQTEPKLLQALINSLVAQTYLNWEACLYVTGDRPETDEVLRRAVETDRRIRVLHGENGGIAANTNQAIDMSRGDWIAFCDHDDLLPPDALWVLAEAIAQDDCDMIYTDEDKVGTHGRTHMEPHLKPDFCPDTLRSMNYVCHLMAARRTLIEEVGGLRPAYDGSQDHDLALRLSEKTDRIRHIAHVCYHWRTVKTSMSKQHEEQCSDAAARAVADHMERTGWAGTVTVEDGVLRLRYLLRDLSGAAFVVAENSREAAPCIKALRSVLPAAVTVQAALDGNRFEAMNRAAAFADKALLLFVDASVRGFTPHFFRELAMYAQRPDVGMVTPMLTDPYGHVTHAGFAVGVMGAIRCRNQGLPRTAGGHFQLNRVSHNVGAVGPACFMIRRSAWQPIDTAYRTAFATADACMAMNGRGLHHVFTPHARAVCTEPESLLLLTEDRDEKDLERFNERWGEVKDPCWNPGLRSDRGNLSVRRTGK
ncbi:MAG: glycosyltransferase [Clostridia bacterium]|nr:glycosyltransferase [Clostridia bacterium]